MKLRPLALVTVLSLGRLLAHDATDFPPKPLTAAEEQIIRNDRLARNES